MQIPFFLFIFISIHFRLNFSYPEKSLTNQVLLRDGQCGNVEGAESKVWISMAICLDSNTQLYAKGSFPYKQSSIGATHLWKQIFQYNVIMQIVTSHPERASKIQSSLIKAGAQVIITPPVAGYTCATSSQILRLLAYRYTEFIKPADIIITADVDAFPTSLQLASPLLERDKLIWLWQYGYSVGRETPGGRGDTFPMSFIASYACIWSQLLDPQQLLTPEKIFFLWNNQLEGTLIPHPFGEPLIWGFDQRIITRSILIHHLCFVPLSVKALFHMVNLVPFTNGNLKNSLCFTGAISHHDNPHSWMHFERSANKSKIVKEYDSIIANFIGKPFSHIDFDVEDTASS